MIHVEAWTVCRRDENRIAAGEINFMRRMADCTCLDYKKNLYIMKKLNTHLIMEFV